MNAIPSCNTIVEHWCAENAERIAVACHELDKPPGSMILVQIGERICYCRCGGDDDAELTPDLVLLHPADPGYGPGGGSEAAGGAAPPRSLTELRAVIGEQLGAVGPISRDAVIAAIVHPGYRRQLAMARGSGPALAILLDAPPRLPPGAATMAGVDQETVEHTTRELLSHASASFAGWRRSGFKMADEQTRDRRLDACRRCPHLADPPTRGLHRVARLVRPEAKVCGLCGCLSSAKARVRSESCPAPDPANPRLTRWGEPVACAGEPELRPTADLVHAEQEVSA